MVKFNREFNKWPLREEDAACQEMFQERGQVATFIIATDGTFTAGSMRAG